MSEVDSRVPSGLDELLGSIRSGESHAPKKRGPKKKEAPSKDFKTVLWASVDKLRAQMNAPEYRHLGLGLIFLKSISVAFVEQQQKVLVAMSDPDPTSTSGRRPTARCSRNN